MEFDKPFSDLEKVWKIFPFGLFIVPNATGLFQRKKGTKKMLKCMEFIVKNVYEHCLLKTVLFIICVI